MAAFIRFIEEVILAVMAKLYPMPSTDNDPIVPVELSNAQKLVAAAKRLLGQNLALGTGVPPEVACAISVNRVHQEAFGEPIGGGASTHALYQALLKHPDFEEVEDPEAGCVIISPTGYGTNTKYPHGHVGIIANYGICSNDSAKGVFAENYQDYADWWHQFHDIEGYPVYLFKRK